MSEAFSRIASWNRALMSRMMGASSSCSSRSAVSGSASARLARSSPSRSSAAHRRRAALLFVRQCHGGGEGAFVEREHGGQHAEPALHFGQCLQRGVLPAGQLGLSVLVTQQYPEAPGKAVGQQQRAVIVLLFVVRPILDQRFAHDQYLSISISMISRFPSERSRNWKPA